MNIKTATPGINMSEGLLHLVRSRFSRLERMFSGITNCEVTLSKVDATNHHNYVMEASLATPENTFFDREQASSFEEALAQLIDKLAARCRKEKPAGNFV